MAFLLNNAVLFRMEYRGSESGVSVKTQKAWLTHKFEDSEARQVAVSVPADRRDKYGEGFFQKGQIYTLSVRAVAGKDSSYVQLLDAGADVEDKTANELGY